MKKALKVILIILLIIVIVALGYVAYVFIDYHRLPDNLALDVEGRSDRVAQLNTEYEISSWNIGFAAYTDDYGFFMDGGKESRAWSKESVLDNMADIGDKLYNFGSDFYFIQEVDTDSTRAYHVNEYDLLKNSLLRKNDMEYTFAQNYDSPYLFYPIFEPHGKSQAGIVTASRFDITSAVRKSLPIQTDIAKVLDLDRCYAINRVKLEDGHDLVLINFHMSAYTTDPTIVEKQIEKLNADIGTEYAKGNYIIAGGDFNKDLLVDSSKYFGVSGEDYSWAQSYPMDSIPMGLSLVAPYDPNHPVPSCRNADGPWNPETQFQITIDGFMVSNNIKVISSKVVDNQFKNSDHNPVQMRFKLVG